MSRKLPYFDIRQGSVKSRVKGRVEAKVKEFIEKGEKLLAEIKEAISKPAESNRFKKLLDGWILHKALNIEWGPSSDNRMNFEDAKNYASDKGGRLPTVKELRSLVDYDRHDPAIDTAFFADTISSWYWSGTDTSWRNDCAWCGGFDTGSVSYSDKDNNNFVRPCRARI